MSSDSQFLTVSAGEKVVLDPKTETKTVHVFDADAISAINTALAARRPLLIRGEPGTGKTQLARAAAASLGRAFLSHTVDSRTESRDLLWTFDAVARLAESQILTAMKDMEPDFVRTSLAEVNFIRPGPLWWAFNWTSAKKQLGDATVDGVVPLDGGSEKGVVLLIDEIDKADPSVPNGLLEALGSRRFEVPGIPDGVTQSSQSDPLVVITTNEERALPDAFLRRCLVLQLSVPVDREALIKWLMGRGRAHFPECADSVLEEAANQLARDRFSVQQRGLCPPGQAEYLDLLRALMTMRPATDADAQLALLSEVGRFALQKHAPEPGLEA